MYLTMHILTLRQGFKERERDFFFVIPLLRGLLILMIYDRNGVLDVIQESDAKYTDIKYTVSPFSILSIQY